jgi:hypothetical protein
MPRAATDPRPRRARSRLAGGWSGVVLVVCLAGCASDVTPSPGAEATATPSVRPTEAPTPAETSTRIAIAVIDVVQEPSSEIGHRVLALRLEGYAGTSAVFRSLEIRAWAEPAVGSSCGTPPVPTVLRPGHADAVQPALADQTRTVVVRSHGPSRSGGSNPPVTFRYGPVPSLNGAFDGWVSFHVPADSDGGFCAFDLRGMVVIVAGESTTAGLPDIRIDTRDRLGGS